MPGIDKECEGDAATHYMACKCREEYFAGMREALERWLYIFDNRAMTGAALKSAAEQTRKALEQK